MSARRTRLAVVLVLTSAVTPAWAQTTSPAGSEERPAQASRATAPATQRTAPPRGYLSINAAYQMVDNNFGNGWGTVYYHEPETVTAAYSIRPWIVIDIGAGIRIWRNLALGAAVSRYRRSDSASVTATVPHPLLYNQARNFSGNVAGPARTETAVHTSAVLMVATTPKIQVALFGGPSFFRVDQVLISAVDFAEAYPYTSVTVASVTTQSLTQSRVGFNAGGDLTILLNERIGFGTLLRFAGVSGRYIASAGTALESRLMKAGGIQAGAGLRVWF